MDKEERIESDGGRSVEYVERARLTGFRSTANARVRPSFAAAKATMVDQP